MQRNLIKCLFLLHFLLLLPSAAEAFRYSTDPSSPLKDISTFALCQKAKQALGTKRVECNDLYHHYKPRSQKTEKTHPTEKARIGSYNILRSSQQRNRKNWDYTAEMIDSEWDLVSLQELQPGRLEDIVANFKQGARYILPGHLLLLEKLQQRDPSWGLIVSPFSQGHDSELLGFLYRGGIAKPVPSEYCNRHFVGNPPYKKNFIYRAFTPKGLTSTSNDRPINDRTYVLPPTGQAYACPLAASDTTSDYFVKLPLVARFKINNFESSYISLHLSFRGFHESASQCMVECQLKNLQLVNSLTGKPNSRFQKAIERLLTEPGTLRLREGTEQKLPLPRSRCQIEPDKMLKDPEKEQLSFERCLIRLKTTLSIIEKNGYLPPTCINIMEHLEDVQRYRTCRNDFMSLRRKVYNRFMKDIFKRVVFQHYPREAQKSSESDEDYYSRLFGSDVVAALINTFGADYKISQLESREFARFFQLRATMAAAQDMAAHETTSDVIVSGDFNLEKTDNTKLWKYWAWIESLSLLGDSELFVEDLTSINSKREGSKNYDHFIFSPSETNECDTGSFTILNFFTATLSSGFKLGHLVSRDPYPFVMSDHLPIGMICYTGS